MEEPPSETKIEPSCALDQSVSFGRFTGELLSWDRWSSFSQNKYMEEAEKCSTPGSVAEKRAYFEAHYKKIAAQTAELLEQERQMQVDSVIHKENSEGVENGNGCDGEFNDAAFEWSEPERIKKRIDLHYLSIDAKYNSSTCNEIANCESLSLDGGRALSNCRPNSSKSTDLQVEDSLKLNEFDTGDGTLVVKESKVDAMVKESDKRPDSLEFHELDLKPDKGMEVAALVICKADLPVLVKEEKHSAGSSLTSEVSEQNHLQKTQNLAERKKDVRLQLLDKQIQKKAPVSVEKNMTSTKTKSAVTLPKPPSNSMSRIPSPRFISSRSASQNLTKKESSSLLSKSMTKTKTKSAVTIPKPPSSSMSRISAPRSISSVSASQNLTIKESSSLKSKNSSAVESRRSMPAIMQMSLSLGSASMDSAPTTTSRRPLIMEKMGDKEIIKRAFKTFQNSFNLSKLSSDEKSSMHQKVSAKEEQRSSAATLTLAKDKERARKVVEKSSAQRGKVGSSRQSASAGSLNVSTIGISSSGASYSPLCLRSEERTEIRR